MTYSELFDDGPFPVKKDDIPEADVQSRCVEYARRHDAWARKFSSPANRSVPDYIFCWEGIIWFVEFKRHGKEPQWDLVQSQIMEPLVELRQRVSEKLAQLQSDEALVPIDRDPVPDRFAEMVRSYFENLGQEDQ